MCYPQVWVKNQCLGNFFKDKVLGLVSTVLEHSSTLTHFAKIGVRLPKLDTFCLACVDMIKGTRIKMTQLGHKVLILNPKLMDNNIEMDTCSCIGFVTRMGEGKGLATRISEGKGSTTIKYSL